jgi:hypothetical protein
MRLSSGLVARCLLFKGLLCLWGQIVPLLFVSGHLWVMLGFGIWWGLSGRVGSTGGATFAACGSAFGFFPGVERLISQMLGASLIADQSLLVYISIPAVTAA